MVYGNLLEARAVELCAAALVRVAEKTTRVVNKYTESLFVTFPLGGSDVGDNEESGAIRRRASRPKG